ncbi:MAG TPA: helix-turn-helix domain-containing protein [Candidatus Levilactobacillus faecigallinarum]|uniref:Helix-turn-helix domain-containing protein n=1 Tax=Candidatus Levilactobacillus faecigallinarum TaxID=2838638 RepID=A0A9D1QV47_9LACO|nr:helix-turn-helix domain-containing protein [Candidatus Levilactobacillus faecigallinarum]
MVSNVYQRIVQLAKLRNMSIYQLEHEAGLSNGNVSKWKENNPSFENIIKVSKALGVSIEYFTKGGE